jgi:hypothetical protein
MLATFVLGALCGIFFTTEDTEEHKGTRYGLADG